MRGKTNCADCGIERGKHFRGNQHIGAAEDVKKRRFPGVGVTDQGNGAKRDRLARTAAQSALPPQRFNCGADAPHPVTNAAPVSFEFLLAGTPGADAAAQAGKFGISPR